MRKISLRDFRLQFAGEIAEILLQEIHVSIYLKIRHNMSAGLRFNVRHQLLGVIDANAFGNPV